MRPGAVIPVGAVDDRPDYDYADGVTLRLYEIPDGARVTTVIAAGGQEFITTRAGNVIRVEAAAGGAGTGRSGTPGGPSAREAGAAEFTVLPARQRLPDCLPRNRVAVA